MALIRINPTKMIVGGDTKAAKKFLGPARSQMEILKNQMSFQNLSQGVRRLWLNDDVYVECKKIFNYQECFVWSRPVVAEEEVSVEYFLILLSTESGNNAIIWDMVSDAPIDEIDTLEELTTKLTRADLNTPIEAICPDTDSHEWNAYPPPQIHDSPLMLPSYIVGYFDIPEYDNMTTNVHSWKFLSGFTYPEGTFDEILNWDLDYVAESPLPYPKKDVLSETSPEDENDEKASYISVFWSSAGDDYPSYATGKVYATEFEALTGCTFPTGILIIREQRFWHPFFWYSNKDIEGTLENLSTDGRGILLADTWADGEWICDPTPTLDKDSYIHQTSGIAVKSDTENIECLLFEHVTVCHKFVDTYGTGMCDTAVSNFDEYFRIYEHGKISSNSLAQEIFELTNIERVLAGTHELVFNSVLSESAQQHAEDQARLINSEGLGSVGAGHTGTDGSNPEDRITAAGYFTWIDKTYWGFKIAENFAATWDSNPAENAINIWKNSTLGYFENMIDEDFSEIGIGVAPLTGGGYCFVQNFGKVDHRYPGFSPFDTTNLKDYVDENFVFDLAQENTKLFRMFLIGAVTLNNAQFYALTGKNTQEI